MPQAKAAARRTPADGPFPGLEPFDEELTPYFFGRDLEILEIVEKLRDNAILLIIGGSGTGKTSLLRAGLLPWLRSGTLSRSDRWIYLQIRPGNNPSENLKFGLQRLFPEVDAEDLSLPSAGRWLLQSLGDRNNLLIAIDRLEEVFHLPTKESEAFLSDLLSVQNDPSTPAQIVATLRSDYYTKAINSPLKDFLGQQVSLADTIETDQIRDMIEKPSTLAGIDLDHRLVEALLQDLGGQSNILPLLQITLRQIWEKNRSRLTLEGYHDIGRIGGALRYWADNAYKRLSEEPVRQSIAKRVLLDLVRFGENSTDPDSSMRLPATDLAPAFDRKTVNEVIGLLVEKRLLRLGRGTLGDQEAVVELAHDVLLTAWPLYRHWIQEERDNELVYQRLRYEVAKWIEYGRENSVTAQGPLLKTFEDWAAGDTNSGRLTLDQQIFLKDSRSWQAELLERKRASNVLKEIQEQGVSSFAREHSSSTQSENQDFVSLRVQWKRSEQNRIIFNYKLESGNTSDVSHQAPHQLVSLINDLIHAVSTGNTDLKQAGRLLARWLLPPGFQEDLLTLGRESSLSDGTARTSLLVTSNEFWIPWQAILLEGRDGRGNFLGDRFALTRWISEDEPGRTIDLTHLAAVVPESTESSSGDHVLALLAQLVAARRLRVSRVSPQQEAFKYAASCGDYTAFHLGILRWSGSESDSLLWMEDGKLLPLGLDSPPQLFHNGPLVQLSPLKSHSTLDKPESTAPVIQSLLRAGAGSLISPLWPVSTATAAVFSRSVYGHLLHGETLGESIRRTGHYLEQDSPDGHERFSFVGFGHPLARAHSRVPESRRTSHRTRFAVPELTWAPERHPPSALIRAENKGAEFIGRSDDLADLEAWSQTDIPLSIRLYTGPGGVGKTRLALELCRRLHERGWNVGFVRPDELPHTAGPASEEISQMPAPALAVIDYAESRVSETREVLKYFAASTDQGPYRIVLLARMREAWWEELRSANVTEMLVSSNTTQHRSLQPLPVGEREELFYSSSLAYAKALKAKSAGVPPPDLNADYWTPLMINMSALGTVQEQSPLSGEDDILDWVLDRERRFWKKHLRARELPVDLLHGVGRAMAAFTLAGGAETRSDATALIEELEVFRGQPQVVIENVADLLHETYPGRKWIMPVEPDILGEHLIERELVHDPQEIFDLVLGPTEPTAPDDES